MKQHMNDCEQKAKRMHAHCTARKQTSFSVRSLLDVEYHKCKWVALFGIARKVHNLLTMSLNIALFASNNLSMWKSQHSFFACDSCCCFFGFSSLLFLLSCDCTSNDFATSESHHSQEKCTGFSSRFSSVAGENAADFWAARVSSIFRLTNKNRIKLGP